MRRKTVLVATFIEEVQFGVSISVKFARAFRQLNCSEERFSFFQIIWKMQHSLLKRKQSLLESEEFLRHSHRCN